MVMATSCPLEESKDLKRRHLAPYLLATSDPLAGDGSLWRGSRFWALDGFSSDDSDDDSADQQAGESGKGECGSEREFIRDAIHVGFSVDDLIRAESLLTERIESPKFSSVDRGAGHISHPRPLATRITEAIADRRLKKSGKPWKGPLPKARSPLSWTLGDVSVKDLRFPSSNGKVISLSELCYQEGEQVDSGPREMEDGR